MGKQEDVSPFIIDVREPAEFAGGSVAGAVNIPLYDILAGALHRYRLSEDHPVIVYCRSGGRAGMACQALVQAGYRNVTNGIDQESVEQLLG